jgi:hypothetical protein
MADLIEMRFAAMGRIDGVFAPGINLTRLAELQRSYMY